MYGPAFHQSPWQRIRDTWLTDHQRARTHERSRPDNPLARAIKSVFVFLGFVLYGILGLIASAVMLVAALLAVPLVFCGALLIIGLLLQVISLPFYGIGLA